MPAFAVAAGLGAGFLGFQLLQALLQRGQLAGEGLQPLLAAAQIRLDLADALQQLFAPLLQRAMGALGGAAFGLQGCPALFEAAQPGAQLLQLAAQLGFLAAAGGQGFPQLQ